MPTFAKEGCRFYSVSTPSFFREVALPERDEDRSPKQRRLMTSLERDAERHGTHVQPNAYEIG